VRKTERVEEKNKEETDEGEKSFREKNVREIEKPRKKNVDTNKCKGRIEGR
jgi:hypothetical protein